MQTTINPPQLPIEGRVPSPGGLPAPVFFDEADIINQEIIRRRNRARIDWLATMALAFVAGALITVTIQLFSR